MKVQLGNHKIHVRWQHSFLERFEIRKKGQEDFETVVVEKPKNQRWTKCIISLLKDNGDPEVLVESIVWCHKQDVYSKCIGRILSLTKAIKKLREVKLNGQYIDKSMRRAIWEAYSKYTSCGWKVSDAKVPKGRAKDTIQFEL